MHLPDGFVATLSALLGEDGWRTDTAALAAHAQDNSWRHALPTGVALPTARDEELAIVQACRAHAVPTVA